MTMPGFAISAPVWTEPHDGTNGYTTFQVLLTINNATSNWSVWIDYVLAKGGIDAEHAHPVGNTPPRPDADRSVALRPRGRRRERQNDPARGSLKRALP
jgi:hypothetical protein